jgi:poly-gamma-glutamate synthesis protein (capsule biosynthesis protein)
MSGGAAAKHTDPAQRGSASERGDSASVSTRCAQGVPSAACVAPALRVCAVGDADRVGEWRYALIGPPFEPTLDVSLARLRSLWREGSITASAETLAALDGALGHHGAGVAGAWSIIPVGELDPQPSVVTVGGAHPLLGAGPLAVPLCGVAPARVTNLDPARLTTLVMSGTTAMTGRTAERIDEQGIADTVRHIKPFFASADLVHVSNEVAFVKNCKPRTGQKALIFCARDRYVALLEALGVTLVELTGSHLTDYGHRSLERTIDMYEQRGWRWYGGGRTQLEASAPLFIEHNGNKLAFVGCNAVNWWIKAIGQGSGTADCDWPRMVWQIQDLRRRGFTPIATVQHRELRTHTPAPDLVRDLRKLAEAGAMFVEGSQAHVAHPWDVHHGAYVHYGPGNILFAQYRDLQRDATVDKLFIYEGRLLSVAHLFTRTEHGQPRPLDERERTKFLGALAAAANRIARPDPTAVVVIPPVGRVRPDSVVIAGRAQHLSVTAPAVIDPTARYPLIVDLDLTHHADPGAFVVVRTGKAIATGVQIAAYMRAKYPIDGAPPTITPAPERIVIAKKHRRRSRLAAR